MARLLADANPNYRRKCRYSRRGCTCYRYAGATGAAAKTSRRRTQRLAEKRQLARPAEGLTGARRAARHPIA
nr:hypothetical protein KPHV_28730 [Kitasatospora purpeofusca]